MEVKLLILVLPMLIWIESVIAKCPEQGFPAECICGEYSGGYVVITCDKTDGSPWDMKKTFDDISDLINDDSILFDKLNIIGTSLQIPQPIGPNTVGRLKFLSITIKSDNKFTTIHPDAFSGTYNQTEELEVVTHTFDDSGPAFELFRNFRVVKTIGLDEDCVLEGIPFNGLAGSAAVALYFSDSGIEVIGDYAFRNAKELVYVGLAGNQLIPQRITEHALDGMGGSYTLLNLQDNRGITHLPKDKFKTYLDTTVGALFVGHSISIDPEYFLHCNQQADWICPNAEEYNGVLIGYQCKELEYKDVFEYCEATNQSPPINRNNTLIGIKIQMKEHYQHG